MYPQLIKDEKVLNPLKKFLRYNLILSVQMWCSYQVHPVADLRSDQMPLTFLTDGQQTGPVGQEAGETEEEQWPPVEASGADPGPAGRTSRWSCAVGEEQTQGGVWMCVRSLVKELSQHHFILSLPLPSLPSLYQRLLSSSWMVSVTSWTWSRPWHLAPTPPQGPALSGCQEWATAPLS